MHVVHYAETWYQLVYMILDLIARATLVAGTLHVSPYTMELHLTTKWHIPMNHCNSNDIRCLQNVSISCHTGVVHHRFNLWNGQ